VFASAFWGNDPAATLLFIAIYNDQGWQSRLWEKIKHGYVVSPGPVKLFLAGVMYSLVILTRTVKGILRLQPPSKWYTGSERGMTLWHDAVDWIGGYPFETATAGELGEFFTARGYTLQNLRPKHGSGCNELVFQLK